MSKEFVDVMLDLEGMGVGNNPALIQIAAVAFDSETGAEVSKFGEKIDLASSIEAGLTVTSGTIKFWMTHESVSQKVREIVMSKTSDHGHVGQHLSEVLVKFSTWYKSFGNKPLVWG